MLSYLPSTLRGILAALILGLNTIFLCLPIFTLAPLKLIPIKPWRALVGRWLIGIAETWIEINKRTARLFSRQNWAITGLEGLSRDHWYLVTANHQSYADIFIMQTIFNKRIPFLKFFIKQELIYVPMIGLAWWALDFPFMKRYSKAYLARYPEKRGEDLKTTRRACEKFKEMPISVVNYLEGTRITPEKHAQQGSPYQHLLKPKAGGIALVLDILGEQIDTILNLTIVYPDGIPSFWDYLCGRVKNLHVTIEHLPIPTHLRHGDYQNDPAFKKQFQTWVNDLWAQKDADLARHFESDSSAVNRLE